ncbi:MAG: hypothetical protein JWM81_161 [Candidatus Saccharibacteria bacterium]|nr:hypothetical protein [Candidatus Saccharibacteria bacterium]
MNKHNQDGSINALLLPLIVAVVLLFGALGFGGWAYSSRQDYKNNTDQKIADAVTLARQQEDTLKDKQFAETEKQPLKDYAGPQAYGSVAIKYPKTWSSFVTDAGSNGAQLDGFFYPGTVPSVTSQSSTFALRFQVIDRSYSDVLQSVNDQQQSGKVQVSPYSLPKVSSAIGVRVEGQITPTRTGIMIILPLRDKTVQVWTEGDQFINDFNNNILPNLTFSP